MGATKTHKLVLYNDHTNDFLYVTACLIRYCNHEPTQAEQCAIIAHNSGKCSVKSFSFNNTILSIIEHLTFCSRHFLISRSRRALSGR